MASGKELPIGGAQVAPLNPGKGEGPAAGGEQPGAGTPPGETPESSEAQPGLGEPGSPVAQPGEGEGAGEPTPAKPGQTAEERIQALSAEVKDLRSQLSAVEDLQDLADELEESLANLQGLAVLETDSPTPPGGAVPGVKPTEVPKGMEAQLQSLTQQVAQLQGMIQTQVGRPDDRAAYGKFQTLETDLLTKAGITDAKEVEIVKELVTRTMDGGNLDWKRPRVAKRVIRGAIDKYNDMKTTMLSGAVQPGTPPATPAEEPPVKPGAVRHRLQPESEDIDPLDQAAQELGPIMEAIWGNKKGGGII